MRISDWSSDVCSSDLPRRTDAERRDFARGEQTIVGWAGGRGRSEDESRFANIADLACDETMGCQKQDRSGREVGGLQVRLGRRAGPKQPCLARAVERLHRSEERRGGAEWVRTWRCRGSRHL